MGYTGFNVDEFDSIEEAFDDALGISGIERMVERNGCYYIACRDEGSAAISACVVMIMASADGSRSYKDIPEEAFPVAIECPIEILRMLTPTMDESANDWREACWEWNARVVDHAMVRFAADKDEPDIAAQVNTDREARRQRMMEAVLGISSESALPTLISYPPRRRG
jgi:hypothetical protein